jgi:uncharacterized protein YjiS (DUF1127 family)
MEDVMTPTTETLISASQPVARTINSVAWTVLRRVAGLAQAFKHRRDAAALASFDDRMLADIGLSRSDLRDALAEPMWRDPTAILVNRADERRVRRRRFTYGPWSPGALAPSIVPDGGPHFDAAGNRPAARTH